MNNNGKSPCLTFKMPEDPRERAVWLRRWVQTLFKVYYSVIDQVAVAMPNKNIKQIEPEIDAAKIELMHLIKPELWERGDGS